jgi:hypothetical protein
MLEYALSILHWPVEADRHVANRFSLKLLAHGGDRNMMRRFGGSLVFLLSEGR